MKTIQIGSAKFPLDDFVICGTAILGIRGSGKTYTAKGVAEQLLDHGVPIIVFDAIGTWRWLRVAGEGAHARGYKVVVAGGENPDLPLTVAGAAEIVRAAIRENISVVFDFYDKNLSKADWRRIVQTCARTLLYENVGLRHVFLEEAAEYCLDERTEVLTKSGFKRIGLVTKNDTVSCFNLTTKKYTWMRPTKIISRQYSGEMVHVKTKAIDCLMTPDHRAVIQRFQHNPERYHIYDPAFCIAEKLPRSFIVPMGGAKCGNGVKLSQKMLRIIGWVATDGNRHSSKRSYISISQSDSTIKQGRSIQRCMREALAQFGASECRRKARTSGVMRAIGVAPKGGPSSQFFVGAKLSRELCKIIDINNLHRVPRKLIEQCSRNQLQALYTGLLEGDGTADERGWRFLYPGHEEGLADDFQEIALRLGIRTVKSFINGQWRVSIASKKNRHWVSHKRQITKPRFDGMTYCLTVPTGAFVIRRNGRVCVTGNCPQRVTDGTTYADVEKLVRMGGNKSLGVTLINQRAQEVNKAVLDLCDNLILLRQRGGHAIDALEKWMDRIAPPEAKAIAQSMPTLRPGESWVFAGDNETPTHTTSGQICSFHPDRRHPVDLKKRPMADTFEFIARMQTDLKKLLEEQKQNDPAELRKEISRLTRELANKVSGPSSAEVDAKYKAEFNRGYDTARNEYDDMSRKLQNSAFVLLSDMKTLIERTEGAMNGVNEQRERALESGHKFEAPGFSKASRQREITSDNSSLGKCERAIMSVLAQYPQGRNSKQVAVISGYSITSGSFAAALGKLRAEGYITGSASRIEITKDGLAVLGAVDRLPQGRALAEYWYAQLDKCEREILRYAVDGYPKSFPIADIATATGYSPTSGSLAAAIGKLRKLELVDGRGEVRASELLIG